MRGKWLRLSKGTLTGLVAMHKYRILAIPQFARIAGLSYKYVAAELLDLERQGVVGYMGYTSIPGLGKTPKVYYLTRKGFNYLANETALSMEEIKAFREVSSEFAWTPQMYHRLRILDCFIALEHSVKDKGHLEIMESWLEYRRRKGTIERETIDYVDDRQGAENRIVPDACIVGFRKPLCATTLGRQKHSCATKAEIFINYKGTVQKYMKQVGQT
jgi:hypothetical protein